MEEQCCAPQLEDSHAPTGAEVSCSQSRYCRGKGQQGTRNKKSFHKIQKFKKIAKFQKNIIFPNFFKILKSK